MKVLKRYPKPYMKNKNPKQNLDAKGGGIWRLATKPLPYQLCMFKSRYILDTSPTLIQISNPQLLKWKMFHEVHKKINSQCEHFSKCGSK